MRRHKRAIARHRMEMEGIERMNRKTKHGRSFFAMNWRKYLEPGKTAKRRRMRAA